jgi:membrane fusion protein, multidrug efflux system
MRSSSFCALRSTPIPLKGLPSWQIEVFPGQRLIEGMVHERLYADEADEFDAASIRAASVSSKLVELQPYAAVDRTGFTVVKGWRRRLILFASVLLGAFLAWEVLTRYVAYTDDAYVRSDLINIAPQVTGKILAVHVRDNQAMRRGDPLVTIDPEPFKLDVAERQAQVQEALAQAGADRDAAIIAKDRVDAAAAALNLAEATQRRIAVLGKEGDVAYQSLDATNEALRRAQSDVEAAQTAIAKTKKILEMHEASISRAKAELATAKWRLERTEISAPVDGTINNLTVRVGDTARAEVPLIGLVDAAAWRIIANYKESYLRYLRIGCTAWVWLDSHPWYFHRARITGIGRAISRDAAPRELLPYVAPTTDWIRLQRRFPVTLVLVDSPSDLYMGADARSIIFP